jgi:ParB/RepB/Spo0J family partition protein
MSNPIQLRPLPTASIRPNARNVRADLGNIDELAASLRANGMQQPVIVTPNPGGQTFSLVDGHRRHAAAVKAGIPQIPALITTVTGKRQTLAMMLAAAMHEQLKPMEQANAFRDLQDDGMTTAEISRVTGYSRPTILARISLLDLPDEAQDMVTEGTLTIAQATDLAKQVRAKGSGSSSTHSANRSAWLTKSHRLAANVEAACTHDTSRRVHVGGVGCGQCWEDAIRADERGELEVIPVFDEVAVLRAMDGHTHRLARPDRLEATRRLHAQGLSDPEIAERLRTSPRQALRDRQALDLPTNFPESSPANRTEVA